MSLSTLDPETLAEHADAVVVRLEDSVEQVRVWAVHALRQLEPAMLAKYTLAPLPRGSKTLLSTFAFGH